MCARPTRIQTEDLLEAARQVFFEHGPGAPTSRIARAAGVSEGTLFKRFATKQDLFAAAMQVEGPDWDAVLRLDGVDSPEEAREHLVAVGLAVMSFFQEIIPRIVLMRTHGGHATPFELVDKIDRCSRSAGGGPGVFFGRMMAHFEVLRAKGLVRARDDAELDALVRLYVGGLHNVVFFHVLGFRTPDGAELDPSMRERALAAGPNPPPMEGAEAVARSLVGMLWRGAAPPATPSALSPGEDLP